MSYRVETHESEEYLEVELCFAEETVTAQRYESDAMWSIYFGDRLAMELNQRDLDRMGKFLLFLSENMGDES